MYDILKNPKKQVTVIFILIVGYWGYHLGIDQSDVPVEIIVEHTSEMSADTLQYESRREFEQQVDSAPPPESSELKVVPDEDISERPINRDVITEYEMRIRFWDMIFGHLASILGSLVALLAPLITVWLNKKGYLSSEAANELQENIST